ncbi:glycosyltransferase family 2 protein [Patescibacteria group bacterium]|nr:glycosyltransferase family 2 protein [Patescibacteria group bacterium]
MKFVLVIPTYNEAENIGKLIDALSRVFQEMPESEFEVLVVEGNSPDGTSDVVKKKQKEYKFVHLLMEEEKAGLGAAYIYGFKYAMKNLNPDVLIEMDADFQHDPKDLCKLVEAMMEGNDSVIGSRYIKGGSIPSEWAFYRKFFSVVGNWVVKIILGIYDVNDFTTGFKATRVKGLLDKINLDTVLSSGFSYKIDLLYKLRKMGAKIKEVPIKFGLRNRGDSKMEQDNAIDTLRIILYLRYKDSESFIRFCVVGFVGFFTDMGIANVLYSFSFFPPNVSATTSALIATFVTYYLNNMWSFSDRKIVDFRKTLKSLVVYYVSSSVPIIFRFWFVAYITGQFADNFALYNFSILVSIIIGLVWNYTIYSKIIWRRS